MLKLAKYLKPFLAVLFFTIVLLYIQAVCDLALPDYMSDIVNDGIASNNTLFIFKAGSVMLAIALVSAASTVIVGYLSAYVAAGVATNLRSDIFKKVEYFAGSEFDKFSTASLITRTTNDITQIQNLIVMLIRMVVYAPILGIGGIIKAVDKSISMSWIIALAVITLICLIGIVFSIALPKFQSVQKLIDKLNLIIRENLSGMLVIRAFNTQKYEEKRFIKANRDLTDTNLFINRLMVVMMPAMMFIMNVTVLMILWVGADMVSAFKLDVGDMMAYMQYSIQIIMAFLMMSVMFIMLPRASVSAQRISEVLMVAPTICDPQEPKLLEQDFQGVVEFSGISFRYPGAEENVLDNINFTAKPGQITAFIGPTGSGKTTLINLLPRFYDPTEGSVRIDGIDIREIAQKQLREKIGYVPQKGVLFSGTIESNLKYANENADEQMVQKIAKVAQAMDFIEAKTDGFFSEIAQGGANVSGGQKQRLSIARALMKNAKINIFDDSFSALDFKTDSALRRELKIHTANSTMIIVAQRISTIMHAEQIIVLDQGRIVGKGTHEQLLENCSVYREIALSQLSKEELSS